MVDMLLKAMAEGIVAREGMEGNTQGCVVFSGPPMVLEKRDVTSDLGPERSRRRPTYHRLVDVVSALQSNRYPSCPRGLLNEQVASGRCSDIHESEKRELTPFRENLPGEAGG